MGICEGMNTNVHKVIRINGRNTILPNRDLSSVQKFNNKNIFDSEPFKTFYMTDPNQIRFVLSWVGVQGINWRDEVQVIYMGMHLISKKTPGTAAGLCSKSCFCDVNSSELDFCIMAPSIFNGFMVPGIFCKLDSETSWDIVREVFE